MIQSAFSLATAPKTDGGCTLTLTGRLTLGEGRELWERLRDACVRAGDCTVDLAGVESVDGGAAAMLVELQLMAQGRGKRVEYANANPETARLLQFYAAAKKDDSKPPPQQLGVLAQVGNSTIGLLREGRNTLDFLGDLVVGLVVAVRRPRTVHWRDLGPLMERAGADGLPIISLINFLLGVILGLQGAIQLKRFGAAAFIANLVGLSVVRELAPLMTAIVVAGRSGAAYAAELGSMTVGEEVDALRTLGQDPQRFLVFTRVLALMLVVPLLTVMADALGCLGGMFIAGTYLGIPPIAYLHQLQQAMRTSDVLGGLLKSGAFAALIALVACQRGLNARGGAAGVGSATTSAVVVILFGLVLLDAAFTWVFSLLGW